VKFAAGLTGPRGGRILAGFEIAGRPECAGGSIAVFNRRFLWPAEATSC
jgi:hypothetical protein